MEVEKFTEQKFSGESSQKIRDRVQKARDLQAKRFAGEKLVNNGEMNTKEVKRFCPLDKASQAILLSALRQLNLSARSYYKTIKLARTIADLKGFEAAISSHDMAEALQYRFQDNKYR